MSRESKQLFMKDYERIVRKHGVYVGACGCCNSPWLVSRDEWPSEDPETHIEANIEDLNEDADSDGKTP